MTMAVERIRVQMSIGPDSPARPLLEGLPQRECRAAAVSILNIGAACIRAGYATLSGAGGKVVPSQPPSGHGRGGVPTGPTTATYEAGESTALSQLLAAVDEMQSES